MVLCKRVKSIYFPAATAANRQAVQFGKSEKTVVTVTQSELEELNENRRQWLVRGHGCPNPKVVALMLEDAYQIVAAVKIRSSCLIGRWDQTKKKFVRGTGAAWDPRNYVGLSKNKKRIAQQCVNVLRHKHLFAWDMTDFTIFHRSIPSQRVAKTSTWSTVNEPTAC